MGLAVTWYLSVVVHRCLWEAIAVLPVLACISPTEVAHVLLSGVVHTLLRNSANSDYPLPWPLVDWARYTPQETMRGWCDASGCWIADVYLASLLSLTFTNLKLGFPCSVSRPFSCWNGSLSFSPFAPYTPPWALAQFVHVLLHYYETVWLPWAYHQRLRLMTSH